NAGLQLAYRLDDLGSLQALLPGQSHDLRNRVCRSGQGLDTAACRPAASMPEKAGWRAPCLTGGMIHMTLQLRSNGSVKRTCIKQFHQTGHRLHAVTACPRVQAKQLALD